MEENYKIDFKDFDDISDTPNYQIYIPPAHLAQLRKNIKTNEELYDTTQ